MVPHLSAIIRSPSLHTLRKLVLKTFFYLHTVCRLNFEVYKSMILFVGNCVGVYKNLEQHIRDTVPLSDSL